MDNIFDRIVIAVPDLQVAVAQYQQMLGVTPFLLTNSQGAPAAWIGLPNTVLELVTGDIDQPRIQGLVFSPDAAAESELPVSNSLQLEISLCNGRAVLDFRQEQVAAQVADLSIDHLVLRTADADACIDLFAGKLGLRLALDKTVPEWGGRMLFFRAGKLTLEVIESDRDSAAGNSFWGIALQCQDIAKMATIFAQRGVTLSDIRDGRKPGTRVATVKSHCLGIPTLLIEPVT
jgi:catechol 2,3-dioxygenase-like lactoylglutathione lyase family enzyme